MKHNQPETVTHPVFGELRWEAGRGVWFTQVRDTTNGWIDVSVDPGDGDRFACLDTAADLYTRAMRAERQLLRAAIDRYLLELFNDGWRLSDDGSGEIEDVLTAEEFAARLSFDFIQISPNSRYAVNLGYDPGYDMFGGHTIDVSLDRDLNYLNAHLIG